MTFRAASARDKPAKGGSASSASPKKRAPALARVESAPSEPPKPTVYLARAKLKLRIKPELNSPETGEVDAGSKVVVVERKTLPSGSLRVRVALASRPLVPVGWATWATKDGTENIVPELADSEGTEGITDAAVGGPASGSPPAYALGAQVYVPRSRGKYEGVAYILSYEAAQGLYTIEVERPGSGQCKICTADLMSAHPRGAQWASMFEGAVDAVAVEVS